jgi:uncharacterized protein involved in exopolysaccharide biosynthesis
VGTFGIVLIAIGVVAFLVAWASFVGSGALYRELGRTGLALDEPDLRPAPRAGSAAWEAEALAELRQLLQAKSDRRAARGEPVLDVEAELAQLAQQLRGTDPGLREEVRQLVVASNERRARRGEPALDVEAEIERRLRDLGA